MGFYNTIEAAEAAHNAAKEAKRYGMSALERHHANYSNVKNASKLRPKRNGELPKPKPISDTDRYVLVMVERYSYLTANQLSNIMHKDVSTNLDALLTNGHVKKEGQLYYTCNRV